jgi:hypothetical protein
MNKKFLVYILILLGGTALLTTSFYDNGWGVVESSYYKIWEGNSERVIVARLAKSQQDGIFSAAGLLGLANTPDGWNFEIEPQYEIYENGIRVDFYLVYKSHPGIQGFILGWFDSLTNFSPSQNLVIIRVAVSILSALTIAIFCAYLAGEYGWLSAVLVLLFSATSEWMVLPASNSYWNLWAFFLPFVANILLLQKETEDNSRSAIRLYAVSFTTILIKVLVTGFEMITTTLVITTVPVLYYAILRKWTWKKLLERMSTLSVVLLAATAAGMAALVIQISINDASIKSSYRYIMDTLDRRAFGNPDEYRGAYKESLQVSLLTVIKTYLNINAFNTQTAPLPWQFSYWKLIVLFAIFTIIFITKHRLLNNYSPPKGMALIISTWYSIAAPLSWFIIFKPTSYIHPHKFPMAWQMPFILLGLALCGFVITDLFKRRTA